MFLISNNVQTNESTCILHLHSSWIKMTHSTMLGKHLGHSYTSSCGESPMRTNLQFTMVDHMGQLLLVHDTCHFDLEIHYHTWIHSFHSFVNTQLVVFFIHNGTSHLHLRPNSRYILRAPCPCCRISAGINIGDFLEHSCSLVCSLALWPTNGMQLGERIKLGGLLTNQ